MITEIWVAIGIITVVVWSWIIWEIRKAPFMLDDYGIEEDDLDLEN
jgi:hypothetical protein|tara:strand:- start:825 stop:962 length:138 start_codon:yes stop_codon:yes gene_type:complete